MSKEPIDRNEVAGLLNAVRDAERAFYEATNAAEKVYTRAEHLVREMVLAELVLLAELEPHYVNREIKLRRVGTEQEALVYWASIGYPRDDDDYIQENHDPKEWRVPFAWLSLPDEICLAEVRARLQKQRDEKERKLAALAAERAERKEKSERREYQRLHAKYGGKL